MTAGDRAAFAELIFAVGEIYGEVLSEMRVELYLSALRDLALPDVRAALDAHVRTQKFFPRPAEIREAVTGSSEDRAELAWVGLVKMVRHRGWTNPPKFDEWEDQAMRRAAMEMYGSWQALCENLPASGPEFLGMAKQFKAAFCAYDRREVRDKLLPPSRDDARAVLGDLKQQLTTRGLPAGNL